MLARTRFIRPSSMPAIEACPGRPEMEARACAVVPGLESLTSHAAEQGTLGHAVIADLLRDAFAGDWSQAGVVLAAMESRTAGLEPWCRDAVHNCIRYACDLLRLLVQTFRVELLIEEHLDGTGVGIIRGGTADLILLCYDRDGVLVRVVVVDWKCGFLYQGEAADHLQLATYAAMAWHRWRPSQGVEAHLAMGRRREFSSTFYDHEAVALVVHRVRAAVTAASHRHPPLRVSPKACQFCKALALCRAAREHVMHAAEEHALFGADQSERVRLADDAAVAKRFAQAAEELAKLWRSQEAEQAQGVQP